MAMHGRCTRRDAAMSALLAGFLSIAVATTAVASPPTTDPRWLPWIGCWAPTAATTEVAVSLVANQRVCVVPAEGTEGVDVVTVIGGEVMSRVRVDARGERRPVSREGCEGWETARWSAAGGRVFLRSELVCAGGVDRISTGVIAIASPSDWVDVEVVTVRDQRMTRVVRYRSAPDTTALDREIAAALGEREMARRAARMAAAALPTIDDVIEASRHLEPATIEAWLLQRMPRFMVESRQLRQLAAARVPGSVIDVVVVLSKPEMFQERLATRGYTLVRIEPLRPRVVAVESAVASDELATVPVVWIEGGGGYRGRSSHSGRCDRCDYDDSDYYDRRPNSSYGYYPYGYYYNPYGYFYNPYGYYYHPYWPYGSYPRYPYPRTPQPQTPARPPVIVHGPTYPKPVPNQPAPSAPEVNGRAINGQGYTRSSDGTATGATPTAPAPAPRQSAPQQSAPEQYTPRQATPRQAAPQPAASQPAAPPPAPTEARPRPAIESKPKPVEAKPEPKPDAPARTAKPRPPAGH